MLIVYYVQERDARGFYISSPVFLITKYPLKSQLQTALDETNKADRTLFLQ